MFVLPLEIVWPVIGIGSIIMIAAAGIVMVRRLAPPRSGADTSERDRLLDEVHDRLGDVEQLKRQVSELEERLDFAERILASQREAPRVGRAPD